MNGEVCPKCRDDVDADGVCRACDAKEKLLVKTCPACDGSGELATSHKFTCYECTGVGLVTESEYTRIVANEQEIQRRTASSVSAWEYRKMGG